MSSHTAPHFSLRHRLIACSAGICVAAGILTSAPATVLAKPVGPDISYNGIMVPDGKNAITLRNIKIAYPDKSFTISIGKLVFAGARIEGTRFTAGSAQIQSVQMFDGRDTYIIPKIELADISTPLLTTGNLDLTPDTGKLPQLLTWALNVRFKSAKMSSLDVRTGKKAFFTAIRSLALTDVANGKIAKLSLASHEGATSDIRKKISVQQINLTGLDLGLLASWFDDDLAQKATGGRRPFIETLTLNNIHAPDMAAGEYKLTNLELAPPDIKPSEIAALLKPANGSASQSGEGRKANFKITKLIYDRFKLGTFELRNLKSRDKSGKDFHAGLFRLENLTLTSLGELRLDDITFIHEKDGPVTIGSISVRGVEIIDLPRFFDRIENYINEKGLTATEWTAVLDDMPREDWPKPRFSSIAITGIKAPHAEDGPVNLGGAGIDAENWLGFFPTHLNVHIDQFNIPISQIKDPELRKAAKDLNIDNLLIDTQLRSSWKEENSSITYAFSQNIKNFASYEISAVFTNMPKAIYIDPISSYPLAMAIAIGEVSVNIKNDRGLGDLIDYIVKKRKIERSVFVNNITLPSENFMVEKIGRKNTAKIIDGIKTFVMAPGSLVIKAKPQPPISFLSLILLAKDSSLSKELRKSLNIEVENN